MKYKIKHKMKDLKVIYTNNKYFELYGKIGIIKAWTSFSLKKSEWYLIKFKEKESPIWCTRKYFEFLTEFLSKRKFKKWVNS